MLKLEEDVPLAPKTTLGVGGSARWYVEPKSVDDIRDAITIARDLKAKVVVLGGGSNLLVADRGLDALVLRPKLEGETVTFDGDRARVVVGAGVAWDPFVARMVALDLAGLECLAGIPGDVGATPIQNVGAYGCEVGETLVEVEVVDRATGARSIFDRTALELGYRDSVFKRAAKDKYVVASVTFELAKGGAPKVRYAELEQRLAKDGHARTLPLVRETVLALRRAKSMVLDPDDENGKSAGSFFMNPTIDRAELARVLERVTSVLRDGEKMPRFEADHGRVKLAAGWLIERAGFAKGFGEGRVGLSTRHALAVVNRGGATSRELVAFAANIRRGVFDRFGVELHPEPVLVGFEPDEVRALTGRLEA